MPAAASTDDEDFTLDMAFFDVLQPAHSSPEMITHGTRMELCPSDPSLALGGPSEDQGTPRKRVNLDNSRQENQDEFSTIREEEHDDVGFVDTELGEARGDTTRDKVNIRVSEDTTIGTLDKARFIGELGREMEAILRKSKVIGNENIRKLRTKQESMGRRGGAAAAAGGSIAMAIIRRSHGVYKKCLYTEKTKTQRQGLNVAQIRSAYTRFNA